MDFKEKFGFVGNRSVVPSLKDVLPIIQLKLMATGLEPFPDETQKEFIDHSSDLIRKIQSKFRAAAEPLCPTDQRIQQWLEHHFRDVEGPGFLHIPTRTLHMDFHGLARTLSLPPDKDDFLSPLLSSYRVANGVLHNPASDRRTTKGTFHVSEGGLPIPGDKVAVPKAAFARMVWHAFHPPAELMQLPFAASMKKPTPVFASLYLRPVVSPEVPGLSSYKDMEIRFFAPGSLISNLDFVESIFGNAGDPFLPENDAALDIEHFTGVTGCVILAPHLTKITKKSLGLPKWQDATDKQRAQGMCWKSDEELYNNGGAFKATFRTDEGLVITLLADNYYGYCKKEVKTQLSFAANFIGRSEEEHSGGALVFPSYNLGDFTTKTSAYIHKAGYTFKQVSKLFGDMMTLQPEGYGIDKKFPEVIYLPEQAEISLQDQKITWTQGTKEVVLRLRPECHYIFPSGYKVRMEKHPGAKTWRLIGTIAEGTLCHKPCTVSGGGKSEISKSVGDSILYKNVYISDFKKDFDFVDKIISYNYSERFKEKVNKKTPSRTLLSSERSLGSVVRLLTPSNEYTAEYNAWLRKIPHYIRSLVFIIKRAYRPEWGDKWRSMFSVDYTDGRPGNELNFNHHRLVSAYLKVGSDEENAWRVFRLRTDFVPAVKLQVEDDITASIVLPDPREAQLDQEKWGLAPTAYKFVTNCEYRLFQRPDDAVHKGLDRQAESDLSLSTNFISNFEPLKPVDAQEMTEHIIELEKFTPPMRGVIESAAKMNKGYFVSSAHPRIVEGKPTGNVRYLQDRPDIVQPLLAYVCEVGWRLRRKMPTSEPYRVHVDSVLLGRRNNPADHKAGIKALAVYNPLHYQDLPEAFMDFIASLSGKSPSTTGFGSEGAMTKGPFNAIWPTADLNNALVSYILTDLQAFSTAAGYVGHRYRMDHDISLLIPELWSRLAPDERNAKFLIEKGYLEPVKDFTFGKHKVEASRLGYRINERFLHAFAGRIFSDPISAFTADILEPEKQNLKDYAEGITHISEAQRQCALQYFEDGSIEAACPPLKALLHIMAHGHWNGMDRQAPEFRKMFTKESMVASSWYEERLKKQQERDIARWEKHTAYLRNFVAAEHNRDMSKEMGLKARMKYCQDKLNAALKPDYWKSLKGTIGADCLTVG
jgi:phosphoenolpyruvate carboxykinase (diphosphate)